MLVSTLEAQLGWGLKNTGLLSEHKLRTTVRIAKILSVDLMAFGLNMNIRELIMAPITANHKNE